MKALIFLLALSTSACWTMYSTDYMAQCQKTCAPNKVDRVSELVCECQGDNETSTSESEQSEHRGDGHHRHNWY